MWCGSLNLSSAISSKCLNACMMSQINGRPRTGGVWFGRLTLRGCKPWQIQSAVASTSSLCFTFACKQGWFGKRSTECEYPYAIPLKIEFKVRGVTRVCDKSLLVRNHTSNVFRKPKCFQMVQAVISWYEGTLYSIVSWKSRYIVYRDYRGNTKAHTVVHQWNELNRPLHNSLATLLCLLCVYTYTIL